MKAYDVFSLLADVASDIAFCSEFFSVFPRGSRTLLKVVLVASLILPGLLLELIITTRGTGGENCCENIRVFWIILRANCLFATISFLPVLLLQMMLLAFTAPVRFLMLVVADFKMALYQEDVYPLVCDSPANEFLHVRGIMYGIFEDLPQLAVQTWCFVNLLGDLAGDLSRTTLAVSFFFTITNILSNIIALTRRAFRLRSTGLSLWRYLGHLFGFTRADKTFALAYARLI